MHHPQYSNEAVEIQLEKCVANGTVKKVRKVILRRIHSGKRLGILPKSKSNVPKFVSDDQLALISKIVI